MVFATTIQIAPNVEKTRSLKIDREAESDTLANR
jgi:hypothetical protein